MTSDEMFELRGEITQAEKLAKNRAKKIGRMHRLHGKGPEGATCGDCREFYVKQFAGTYRKCRLFGTSGGPGTDWQMRWPACGKFQKREVARGV